MISMRWSEIKELKRRGYILQKGGVYLSVRVKAIAEPWMRGALELPSKLKIGIAGCLNGCTKPHINDPGYGCCLFME
jgi:dissimilatory sulfite reductase (desulfoviridin) alpha/beta subunit